MIIHKVTEEPTKFRAAGCFCLCEGSLLIIQRQRLKSFGMHWAIPTGKIEQGENARACMARELCEELNLKVDEEDLRPLSDFLVEDNGIRFEYVAFTLTLSQRPRLELKNDEVRLADWVPIKRVLKRRVVPYFYNTLHDLLDWHEHSEIQWCFLPEPEAKSAGRRYARSGSKSRISDTAPKPTAERKLHPGIGTDLFR